MGEYSALKEAIDTAMGKIKNAKNSIKSAINTAGASMHVHVDDTDTFRSYADAIRLMYQRIWSSDDGTDAPAKCIITNKDFPAAPMHNYGYIDINDLSADRFGDDKKYYAASSFIVDIQNPPVPILADDNYILGRITSVTPGSDWTQDYTGEIPPSGYYPIMGYNSSTPQEIINDSVIGKYIIFLVPTHHRNSYSGDDEFIDFPGEDIFYSYSRSYYLNTEITIMAYGEIERFKYLGTWDNVEWGVWQRLTGGN